MSNEKIKHRIFTEIEKKRLLTNSNVIGIKYEKEIIYSNHFKLWAVEEKLKYPYKTARQIFEEGNFDMTILDERTPQRRLNYWMKKYQKFGIEYFQDYSKKNYYSSKRGK